MAISAKSRNSSSSRSRFRNRQNPLSAIGPSVMSVNPIRLNHGSQAVAPGAIREEGREEWRARFEYVTYFAQGTFYSDPAIAIKADILHDTIEAGVGPKDGRVIANTQVRRQSFSWKGGRSPAEWRSRSHQSQRR